MLPLSILLPGLAIAGALALAGVQTLRLKGCQADVATHKAQVAILGTSLAEQNRAVEALKAESALRAARSAMALRKAEDKARVWDDQARRLTAVLTAPRPAGEAAPTDCRSAWSVIREGK